MKRRQLLKLAPAALAAGAVPVAAVASEETPVMRAYRVWREGLDAYTEASKGDLTNTENDAWCMKVYALADDVLDQPSTGPLDFVYKLIAQTFDGDHDIGDCPRKEEIWAEARALIGGAA